jgi:hypothetical protein
MYVYLYTYIFTKFLLKFAHFLQHYSRYETLTNNISKIALTFSYSADISRYNRIKKYKSKNKQKLRFLNLKNLENSLKMNSITNKV